MDRHLFTQPRSTALPARGMTWLAVGLALALTSGQVSAQGLKGAAPVLADPVPAPEVMPQATSCSSGCLRRWYGGAEALWLTRSNFSDKTLSIQDNAGIANDTVQLRSSDPRFNYDLGVRLTLGAMLSDCWGVEASYFGLQEHSASATSATFPTGVGNFGFVQPYWGDTFANTDFLAGILATTNPTLGFTNAYQHFAVYSSQLHNAELNLRRFWGPNLSLLFGFRYVYLAEEFIFGSIDEQPGQADGAFGPGTGGGAYTVRTRNNLFGLQVGGDYWRPVLNRLDLGALAKAAVFANCAEQNSTLSVTVNNADTLQNTFAGNASQVRVATLIELGVFARVHLTNALSIKGGYNLYFLNGVALAPDNLAEVPFIPGALSGLNANGNVVFHGPSVGVEARW